MSPEIRSPALKERRAPALVSVDGRTYPLRSVELEAHAEGGLAASKLIQEFENPYDEPLEAIYMMPLPADGAVLGYSIRMGDRIIRGEIEPREEAEAKYREALLEGKTAGLLEEERADTFQQRLGNLPPRTDVRVEIEVLQPLAFLAGTEGATPYWEYRFPTVVGPRYQGAPGRVPDAERLEADRADRETEGGIPTRIRLRLVVADRIEGRAEVRSPSHPIASTSWKEGREVALAEGARLDRDVVIQWSISLPEVGVRVVEGGGLPSDDGCYALVTITPPSIVRASYHRDLTLLIDSSGSMSGQPIEIAKRVAGALLRSLEAGDRFEVWHFSNSPSQVSRGFEDASSSSIERSIQSIEAIQTGGGTEMVEAVKRALTPLRRDSQRQVVLITDGEIGFEGEVLAEIRNRIPSGVRIHVVAIGSAPNRTLTRGIGRAGRGVELFASSDETADEAVRRLAAATSRPVLTDLTLSGSALLAAAPARPRDVFAGQPAILAAELKREGGTLEVSGNLAGSPEVWIWRLEIPSSESGEAVRSPLPIGALYGREQLADLEIQIASARGPMEDLDREIEAIGMRHRIVSRRTSLVAVAEESSVDPRQPRRRERLAVELPEGVSAEGVGLERVAFLGSVGGIRDAKLSAFRLADTTILGALDMKRGVDLAQHIIDIPFAHRRVQIVPLGVVSLSKIEGRIAFFELEVPIDAFQLPRGLVEAVMSGADSIHARVVEGESSPRGPHPKGVLVRLVLERMGTEPWPAELPLELLWSGPDEAPQPGAGVTRIRFLVVDARGPHRAG
jgi:Ca-activated chloride channel homolog